MTSAHTPAATPVWRVAQPLLLSFPIALFTIGVLTDLAYLSTAQIQWTNFSAWLITGGLVFGGVVLAWSLVDLALRRGRAPLFPLLLAAMWLAGLVNIFQHSRDAWSSVGAFGLILSLLSSALALAAGWVAFSRTAVGPETLS